MVGYQTFASIVRAMLAVSATISTRLLNADRMLMKGFGSSGPIRVCLAEEFQADHAAQDGCDAENLQGRGGLCVERHAQGRRADGAEARPYRICSRDRNGLGGLAKQINADGNADEQPNGWPKFGPSL